MKKNYFKRKFRSDSDRSIQPRLTQDNYKKLTRLSETLNLCVSDAVNLLVAGAEENALIAKLKQEQILARLRELQNIETDAKTEAQTLQRELKSFNNN